MSGIRKTFGPVVLSTGSTSPRRPRDPRPARRQRRRQDDVDERPLRPLPPRRRRDPRRRPGGRHPHPPGRDRPRASAWSTRTSSRWTYSPSPRTSSSAPVVEAPARLRDAGPRIAELSERFGLAVDPSARVADLPVGVRQRVEILKALYRGAKILVLDEPTTNLTPQEVDDLFASMRAIVDEGMSASSSSPTRSARPWRSATGSPSCATAGGSRRSARRHQRRRPRHADGRATIAAEQPHWPSARSPSARKRSARPPADDAPTAPAARRPPPAAGRPSRGLTVARPGRPAVRRRRPRPCVPARSWASRGSPATGRSSSRRPSPGSALPPARSWSTTWSSPAPTATWLRSGVVYVPEDRQRDGILPVRGITENLVLGSHRSPATARPA